MGLIVKVRTFNSVINFFRTLALPHVVLSFIHLQQSLQFLSKHKEINELLGHDKVRLTPLTFSFVDLLIFISSLLTLFLKGKLNYCQYLTDSENFIFGFVIVVYFFASCGYLLFALDVLFRDHITAKIFREKLRTAMLNYPLGSTKPLVDLIQSKYSCCGVEKAAEWFALDWHSRRGNWSSDDIPYSCCSNALLIPCIHLNLKKHTYYVKYNSSSPTIWTSGCVIKFTDVYLVDYEWLIYFGIFISIFSITMAVLDRMLQTADNNFCYKRNFRLAFIASDPPWMKLISRWRQREELVRVQSSMESKPRVLRSSCSILSIVSRFRKRKKCCKKCKPTVHSRCSCATGSQRSSSPCNVTAMPLLLSPGERCKLRGVRGRETSSVATLDSENVIDEPSATSSSSGRKRKLEENLPLPEKRLKKIN